MDTATLVTERIDDAEKLIKELSQQGFEVAGAFWLHSTENGKWRFYVISPGADTQGRAQAYRQLHTLIRQMPQSFGFEPLGVRLIGPTDPIARQVLDILQSVHGPQQGPIRWGGIRLGNVSIDGAYLFPPPVPASTP